MTYIYKYLILTRSTHPIRWRLIHAKDGCISARRNDQEFDGYNSV